MPHLWGGGLSLLNSQQWGGLCLPWSYSSPSEGSRAGLCTPSLDRSSWTPQTKLTKLEHILLPVCLAAFGAVLCQAACARCLPKPWV